MNNKSYTKLGCLKFSLPLPGYAHEVSSRLTIMGIEDATWEVNTALRYQTEKGKNEEPGL